MVHIINVGSLHVILGWYVNFDPCFLQEGSACYVSWHYNNLYIYMNIFVLQSILHLIITVWEICFKLILWCKEWSCFNHRKNRIYKRKKNYFTSHLLEKIILVKSFRKWSAWKRWEIKSYTCTVGILMSNLLCTCTLCVLYVNKSLALL